MLTFTLTITEDKDGGVTVSSILPPGPQLCSERELLTKDKITKALDSVLRPVSKTKHTIIEIGKG